MKTILEELKEIEAKASALVARIEAENTGVVATVSEIRRVAILEEIFRIGGTATPEKISEFSKKYGKDPSSSAGYYSGKSPSLVASEDRESRLLTDTGKQAVEKARKEWGENWLDRVPLDIVGNAHTPDAEVTF